MGQGGLIPTYELGSAMRRADVLAPIGRGVADDCCRERSCAVPLVCGEWLALRTVLLGSVGCVCGRGQAPSLRKMTQTLTLFYTNTPYR